MRLPIVQFPNIVANNLSHFAPVFSTEEQKKHFCEYVTGLIAGDKATVTAINALFLNKNDQSSLNKIHHPSQLGRGQLESPAGPTGIKSPVPATHQRRGGALDSG
jgi:hypothetical protein